jgi:Cof subfamily protein (haloacid dehalogenase superfamily)
MDIRLIALDLDGTTMRSNNTLSPYNQKAIEDAIGRGVEVVVASGRAFTSLPKEVMDIRGLRYAISSNGAHISDLRREGFIYSNYINAHTVDEAIRIADRENLMLEAFVDGRPYIERDLYEDVRIRGSMYRDSDYVLNTRTPVEDLLSFMTKHRNCLENINFFFYDDKRLEEMKPQIYGLPNCHVTSSVRNNIEVGGAHSTKAYALQQLSESLGILPEQIMSFGDAGNDIPMIQFAGFGVAMGNAWDEVKEAADYVAPSNNEDGVGKTIRKFILD